MKKKLSHGLRKYLRKEKSRIRRAVRDLAEQKKQIEALCEKYRQ